MKKSILISLAMLSLAACSEIPKEAFINHGDPENLIDISGEVVNVSLAGPNAINELVDWVNHDQPTRAKLSCANENEQCRKARQALEQFGVQYEQEISGENMVALVYERVMARDCDNHFVSNHINPYNLNHRAYGCSVAANMVQMVTDKRQFVDPKLMDYQDGYKAVQSYGKYNSLQAVKSEDSKSLLDTGK